jgi:hypothetical protein
MARLARKLAWAREAIFHGTRYANETLRSGRLIPPDWGDRAICLTRSPETAAYFALMLGKEVDQWSGAVLVLNRGSLSQRYRLEPCRYEDDEDDRDEREERIMDGLSALGGTLSEWCERQTSPRFLALQNTSTRRQNIFRGPKQTVQLLTGKNGSQARDSFEKEETRCATRLSTNAKLPSDRGSAQKRIET